MLIIHGKQYTVSTIHKLPSDISSFASSSKNDNNTVAFFGELNPFSNFHTTPFYHNNKNYHCSKQYIQESKALHFGNIDTANAILQAKTALDCKLLARDIKSYDHENWKTNAKEVCKPGLSAKFLSSEPLLNLLKSTGDKMIIEACHDQLWGTGVPLRDKDCLNREKWTGQGILGEILCELRSELTLAPMEQS